MGSPTFGLLPGNNAPQPFSFAGNNPTGGTVAPKGINSNFPNYPMYSPINHGSVSPTASAPMFSASDFKGLSTGLFPLLQGTPQGASLYKELVRSYGKGMGDTLFKQLGNGFFNPQTAAAFLNAMQPAINKGESDLLNSFGAEGSRFGTAAAYGEGTYLSQAHLNEEQTLATMYMNAQQEQIQLEQSILPTLQKENANSGGGMWSDIIGGLEIAGSVAADIFTAGAAIPFTTPILASGIGTLTKGLTGGGNSGNNPAPMMPGMNPMQNGTPPFFPNNTNYRGADDVAFWDKYDRDALSSSAGNSLFGSTGDSNTDFAVPFNQ
jgi:hypothetical protein